MINVPAQMNLHPDILVGKHLTADAMTGDGIFADTDLVRIPYNGYLLVQGCVTATGDSLLYVPQKGHIENRTNHLPVVEAGAHPMAHNFPWYKVRVKAHMTPRILYDEVSDTAAYFMGAFFKDGKNGSNPVAMNTPDITVVKNVTATTQNALEDSDLDECPYPGALLVYAVSDVKTAQIQINQANYQPGNYSELPVINSGLAVDISKSLPFKTYVPATGNPTVTLTIASGTVQIVACFYIDWNKCPRDLLEG